MLTKIHKDFQVKQSWPPGILSVKDYLYSNPTMDIPIDRKIGISP